jgi:predicted CXXCH cytochrome family protein
MTQRPTAEAVAGAFDGQGVEAFGARARPFARDGKFFFELPAGSGTREAEVALAVGSRRYQQYFEREERGSGSAFVRLPLLWHIEQKRWLHLNAVFLEGDDPDWSRHRSTWNENCVFCHNTGPRPGLTNYSTTVAAADRSFTSSAAELGIACEACHGPGERHAERHATPLERYARHLAGEPDATIVNPSRLDKQRSVDLCGQCHGQRLPEPLARIEAWITTGPTFRAGNLLADHARPLSQETTSPRKESPDEFRPRFWKDGTPRLTAYEYQGITASACFLRGPMTCLSCHTMHSGDPRGQLPPALRGDRACTQCHAAIGKDVAAHTKHAPEGSGSRCLECHMPRIVYGILDLHRSHKIEIPDPARDADHGRPDACTLCHLDKSPLWAAREAARLWPDPSRPEKAPSSRPDAASLEIPDAMASLLCGDAVQRVVHARAAGRPDAALAPRDKAALRVHLIATLCDAYPSVRMSAHKSLVALEQELPLGIGKELGRYDFQADQATCRERAHELFEALAARGRGVLRPPEPSLLVRPDLTPDLPALVLLLNRQARQVISIGE